MFGAIADIRFHARIPVEIAYHVCRDRHPSVERFGDGTAEQLCQRRLDLDAFVFRSRVEGGDHLACGNGHGRHVIFGYGIRFTLGQRLWFSHIPTIKAIAELLGAPAVKIRDYSGNGNDFIPDFACGSLFLDVSRRFAKPFIPPRCWRILRRKAVPVRHPQARF